MVLKRIFGDRAPHKHIQQYHGVSEAWMQGEQQRLADIAIDLGIETQIVRSGDQIELGFKNVKDAAMLRLRAFGNDHNPGRHVHSESFEAGDEAYRDAWLEHARAAIDELGLPCRIEADDNRIHFRFDTNGEHAIFTEMRDRGVFHRLALADIGGPTPHV
jgi:hypothetical protein